MRPDVNWLAAAAVIVLALSCIIGYQRGFVKEVVSAFFIFLALAIVWVINPHVNQFLMERTPVYGVVQEKCKEVIQEQMQEEGNEEMYIRELPFPSFVKEELIENNTPEVYRYLVADTFSEYLAGYLARMLTNGIGFLISYLMATVLIRIVVNALDLIARLPVLRGINRFAGIFIGALRGILFIWIAFLVITVCWNTFWGQECIKMIEANRLLGILYEKNPFLDIFMSIFYGK